MGCEKHGREVFGARWGLREVTSKKKAPTKSLPVYGLSVAACQGFELT